MDDLAQRLADLAFADLTQDEVTGRIIDEVAAWGQAHGWRVYRRAPSVVRLPPPMDKQHSVVDVALARPAAPPIVVEVDHTDRKRTVEKLLAEAAAGRVAVWVRWGPGRIAEPPAPIRLVPLPVTRSRGRYSRTTGPERPAPSHSATPAATGEAAELPLPQPGEAAEPSPPQPSEAAELRLSQPGEQAELPLP
ncbi:hypothetical protein [Actinoplanes auranticolor]|uniref:Uncharacterized protein n=1 Tax=Actinoplanes auranticolor TaxID=47988 RepID=A0A919SM89_9ACTN|nr:hypothetical protein [Actinoplanes auranticolor]GIM73508.1 hypothetical protein Aau02nite_56390 [Actinoplanes auranticolor]